MRVRFLREAGGLGDVLRCLGTVGAVRRALPDCETWFYTIAGYADLARACPDVDRVVEVDYHHRRPRDAVPDPRKHRYLARHTGPWDATVDMFCPAFAHERETRGAVYMDRIDCWTAVASRVLGVDLVPTLARLDVDVADVGWADGWLYATGCRGTRTDGPLVGVQPLSVDSRRSLSAEQVRLAVEALTSAGCRVVYMHGRHNPQRAHEMRVHEWVRRSRTPIFVAPSLLRLAAMVSRCDAMLCSDSGVLHVAAAMGVPVVGTFGITTGSVICKHYERSVALDAGPRERDGLPCARVGRACYMFDHKAREVCGAWCPALRRIPGEAMALSVLSLLDDTRRL